MSSYPPGMTSGYMGEAEVTLECPNCKHRWWAGMYGELGGWFFSDEDEAFCPKDCRDAEGYALEGVEVEFDPSLRPQWVQDKIAEEERESREMERLSEEAEGRED